MSRKRQNNQRKLAFATEGSGAARAGRGTGAELLAAERGTESPAKRTNGSTDSNRRIRDPYVRWCGRGGGAILPPIPILAAQAEAYATRA